jgi:hypothetical protein
VTTAAFKAGVCLPAVYLFVILAALKLFLLIELGPMSDLSCLCTSLYVIWFLGYGVLHLEDRFMNLFYRLRSSAAFSFGKRWRDCGGIPKPS